MVLIVGTLFALMISAFLIIKKVNRKKTHTKSISLSQNDEPFYEDISKNPPLCVSFVGCSYIKLLSGSYNKPSIKVHVSDHQRPLPIPNTGKGNSESKGNFSLLERQDIRRVGDHYSAEKKLTRPEGVRSLAVRELPTPERKLSKFDGDYSSAEEELYSTTEDLNSSNVSYSGSPILCQSKSTITYRSKIQDILNY